MYVRIRQTSLVHSMYSLCALGGGWLGTRLCVDTVEFLWSTVHSHMTILTVHSHTTILGKEPWDTHKFELRTTYESA